MIVAMPADIALDWGGAVVYADTRLRPIGAGLSPECDGP